MDVSMGCAMVYGTAAFCAEEFLSVLHEYARAGGFVGIGDIAWRGQGIF